MAKILQECLVFGVLCLVSKRSQKEIANAGVGQFPLGSGTIADKDRTIVNFGNLKPVAPFNQARIKRHDVKQRAKA